MGASYVGLRWGPRVEEDVMDARMRAEAITTRIGAIALPLGVILFVVVTAIFHPHREAPMDNLAVFMEYAESDSWVAIHFAQWFAALLLVGGLVALLLHYHKAGSECSSGSLWPCCRGAGRGRSHDATGRRRRGAQVGGG